MTIIQLPITNIYAILCIPFIDATLEIVNGGWWAIINTQQCSHVQPWLGYSPVKVFFFFYLYFFIKKNYLKLSN